MLREAKRASAWVVTLKKAFELFLHPSKTFPNRLRNGCGAAAVAAAGGRATGRDGVQKNQTSWGFGIFSDVFG